MVKPSVRWLRVAIAAVSVAVVVAVAPVAFGAVSGSAKSSAATKQGSVTTASSAITSNTLDASLREAASNGGSAKVDVLVMQAKGTGRPRIMTAALQVHLKGDTAHEFWAGTVRADRLVKLATGAGVDYVADNGERTPPVIPDVITKTSSQRLAAGKKAVAKLRAAAKAGVLAKFAASVNAEAAGTDAVTSTPAGQPTDWFDVGLVHKSSLAWANGFTGSGVKVAVADDGIDFGHSDLQGTEAYVTKASSPYYGWPMAFDPFSTYAYALDQVYGTGYVANGDTWFSSTTATVRASSRKFDGVTYTLPGTSKSGVYHIGHLWDENLATYWYGEYPALLVADEKTAGVYDTVYVDLDDDHNFTDDKKLTKASPISYLDFVDAKGNPGSDGIADLSGGMLYWISDGTNQPPFFDQEFGLTAADGVSTPGSGDLVCMIGAYDLDSDHGTLCASNVSGQGVVDGSSIDGEYPSFKSAITGTAATTTSSTVSTGTGMVQGAGKSAKLVAISDIYMNYSLSTLMAYDYAAFGLDGVANSGDEIQIVSNSYGESATDNDEWDYPSRYVTELNTLYAPSTTFLFATGNGGPGYGTNTSPAPSTAIKVGASTLFGSDGGWDSIDTSSQVTFGDVIPFSNRGPTAMGHLAPTVVADGAYAAGSEALSLAGGNGWTAWEIWGGTSRSAPVASGNLALVYQAFKSAHGRWPTWTESRDLLASGATDLNYDTLTQGSGMVDADRSTKLAAGLSGAGVKVSPSTWYPGSFRGLLASAFEQIVHPGDVATGTVTVTNPSTSSVDVAVSDSWMQRVRTKVVTLTIDPSDESAYDFNRPDELIDVSDLLQSGDQLMTVRAVISSSEFDRDGDGTSDDRIRLLTYDWTDRNGNGSLWTDTNGNGVVNAGEIDDNEYLRFTYSGANGPSLENRVQDPLGRSHGGVFVGIQHQTRSGSPIHVTIEISFWRRTDMPWLSSSTGAFTLAAGSSRSVGLTCSVPASAPLGVYEGEYRFSADDTTTVLPVVMTVAGSSANITYGGTSPYEQLMDGDKVFGYLDWNWRAEAGDWRFFDTDVPESEVSTGSLWLAHTSWETTPTDIDTLLYGPGSASATDAVLGPYDLTLTGGSPNTNTGAGVWTFDTATGGAEDWVTGSLSSGLNKLMLHTVGYAGASIGETFTGEAGVLNAAPAQLSYEDTATTHATSLTFRSTLDLPGFGAVGYGLSRVTTVHGSVEQGAYYTREFTVSHAAYIELQTTNDTSDIDLYLERWDGTEWVQVAASETSSGNEYVKVLSPADGQYRARVYGYSVTGGTDSFGLVMTIPEGENITVSGLPAGAVSAGTTITVGVSFAVDRSTLDSRDDKLVGVVAAGPTGATRALQIPVELSYPLYVEEVSPASDASDVSSSAVVTARFSRRIDSSTLTSQTFYLVSSAGTLLRGDVTYDDTSATAYLDAPMSPGTTYRAVITSDVMTADGTGFDGYQWSFSLPDESVPTLIAFSIPSSSVSYGSKTPFTAKSYRYPASAVLSSVLAPAADPGAPMALQFRASGSSTWTTSALGVADATGTWHGSITGSRPGSYRAVRVANWSGHRSTSASDKFDVKFAPALSAKTTSTRRGHALKVSISVKPSSASAHRTAYLQRYENGHWVTYRSVRLSSTGKATYWASRRTKGTRTIRLRLTSGKGYATGYSSSLTLRWR
jgi:hypothetical protein